MKKIKIFTLIMVMALVLLTLAACSNSSTPSSNTTKPSQSTENVREASEPSELIGTPDRIYIVKGKNERTIEPGTDEYNEVLELLRSRFPEKLKEAARAITWADEAGFNRDMMREEFDFLELSYDTAQTVNLNCMDSDYPSEEVTFEMMIFPLSEITGTVSIDTHKTSGVVGRSYGPLDDSAEILVELLGYAD